MKCSHDFSKSWLKTRITGDLTSCNSCPNYHREKTVILSLVFLLLISASSIAQETASPVFSFWRNLVLGRQAIGVQSFRTDMAPMPPEMAERCCAVKPGQAVTLLRRGRIIGSGRIKSITATEINRAGDNRAVFFDVAGLPDSIGIRSDAVFPRQIERNSELYVIGEVAVKEYAPTSTSWREAADIALVVREALESKAVQLEHFMNLAVHLARARSMHVKVDSLWSVMRAERSSTQPETLVELLRNESKLIEYSVEVGNGSFIEVRSSQRKEYPYGPYFVRVSSPRLTQAVYVPGELDFFLQVDGNPYMVLRHLIAETGAWCYLVYRLYADRRPERVHVDGSWST